jgi:hypothetical protein
VTNTTTRHLSPEDQITRRFTIGETRMDDDHVWQQALLEVILAKGVIEPMDVPRVAERVKELRGQP